MSTLQIGLVVLGVLVLLALWVYNRWQIRWQLPRRMQGAIGRDNRSEPETHERTEPTLDPEVADVARVPAMAPIAAARILSERLDAIITLRLEKIITGDAVLQSLPSTRRVGSKPFFVEGLPEDTTSEDAWEAPQAGQRYRALRAGIQLTNRAGPLNEIEYSEFVQKLQTWSESLFAIPELPDMLTVIRQARELDHFAALHDVQLVFKIRARRTGWSPGYVMQHASRLGFVPGALPGRMVLPSARAGASPLLTLYYELQAALADDPELAVLREIQLRLETTHVSRAEEPYRRLSELSQSLAGSMDGVVCDEAGQAIDFATMDRIFGDLELLYEALEARGVPAGSDEARRLFS